MNKLLNKKNNKQLITIYLSRGNLYDRFIDHCEKRGIKATHKTIDLISQYLEEKEKNQ
tara:strand:- start:366 stop:539 length:174 start_codon:yes stop_codon:yes gene_type:complete